MNNTYTTGRYPWYIFPFQLYILNMKWDESITIIHLQKGGEIVIGTIPSASKTYEVMGALNTPNLIEGKVYHDENGRLFIYSKTDTRSNPSNGYFPIWNGKDKIFTGFSNEKYLKDITPASITSLAANISSNVAKDVQYRQRRSDDETILRPAIKDEDNMFTQTVKAIIRDKNITMIDLVDMCEPRLDQQVVESYYSSLNKISLMRMEKWNAWLTNILHLSYVLTVYKNDKMAIQYKWPEDVFDTGIVKYEAMTMTNDDPLKKIVKILMIKENISKATLRAGEEVDDYTVNNMMTILNGDKPMSSQIFSRFIRMSGLSYMVELFDTKNNLVFTYKENGGKL